MRWAPYLACTAISGVLQLCAHEDVRIQQSGDRTVGFGADRGPYEIALLYPSRLSKHVKVNACDSRASRQLFHRDDSGGIYAIWGKASTGELIRERHGERRCMGGGD
jgi:hypothetical protein